jgi:hypothetical protein
LCGSGAGAGDPVFLSCGVRLCGSRVFGYADSASWVRGPGRAGIKTLPGIFPDLVCGY